MKPHHHITETRDSPLVLSLPKSLGRFRLKNENIVSAVVVVVVAVDVVDTRL